MNNSTIQFPFSFLLSPLYFLFLLPFNHYSLIHYSILIYLSSSPRVFKGSILVSANIAPAALAALAAPAAPAALAALAAPAAPAGVLVASSYSNREAANKVAIR